MSIASSIYADYAEEVRKRWVKELKTAIENNDMEEVKKVVDTMDKYYFSE